MSSRIIWPRGRRCLSPPEKESGRLHSENHVRQTPKRGPQGRGAARGWFLQRTSRQIAGRPTRPRVEFDGWSVPLQGGERPDVLVLSLCNRRSRCSRRCLDWRSRAGDSHIPYGAAYVCISSHDRFVWARLFLAVLYPRSVLRSAMLFCFCDPLPWLAGRIFS